MFEVSFNTETLRIGLTLLITVSAIYSFVSERISPDVTALLAILALLITGILTPIEAFSGFSHPATVTVASVLVLSAAIERTGALSYVARHLLTPFVNSELLFTAIIMGVIGVISAFVNNTAAVAIFIPVVLEVCSRHNLSPGKILMPMSHAATFGGMCTLIGTSTNLVTHEFALKQGLEGFSMFELGKIGIPMFLLGSAYILLIGRRFLPDTRQSKKPETREIRYLAELIVQEDSAWIEKGLYIDNFNLDYDLELVGIVRKGQVLSLKQKHLILLAGDSLLVRGQWKKILKLATNQKLLLHRPETAKRKKSETKKSYLKTDGSIPKKELQKNKSEVSSKEKAESDIFKLAEVVVLTPSGLIGRTLKEIGFAERFDTVVLALRRRGFVSERPSTTPLKAGDMLIVEGREYALDALGQSPGFLVLSDIEMPEEKSGKMLITLLTLATVIIIVSFGLMPIVTAAIGGCAVLILSGCLKPREVYEAIDLSLVFLLAGSLALGVALEKTGITGLIAQSLMGITGVTGPVVVMIGFFFIAVLLSELMSNSGTVALLGPVAISSATQMGINPMTLLAAVTFGSSAAFAMPIGYQTSLMIYGPGGYNVRDFIKMGVPLDILLALIALLLIPYFWSLGG